ncbi:MULTISPECIES: hypothetical protein [Streptomyces]|uniref:Uncharacterized protein n=1 Tax=Streptomyces viridochromogenes TaxID=1938 RepID=A0A0L8J9G2_STRVR|nr:MULTISPECIES: hypothetical protein [Streptomyces]KOG10261.1 hypothetical protein ADK34_35570 [Streptomyces viridochromogenes]
MTEEPAPARAVVTRRPTGPGPAARPARVPIPPGGEPERDPETVRALVHGQLRTGLAVVGLLAALLGPLPLAFRSVPQLGGDGRPVVVWAVLGVVVYPLFVLLGRWYVRRAELTERRFNDAGTRARDGSGTAG